MDGIFHTVPHRIFHSVVLFLLAACLLGGCRAVTQPPAHSPAQSSESPAYASRSDSAAAGQLYAADSSVCGWSLAVCFSCEPRSGGAGGEEYIAPAATPDDAVAGILTGDSPAFSPDGKWAGTVDGEQVRIWNADDGSPLYTLAGDAFVFSPDGSTLALQQADGWYLYDTAAEKPAQNEANDTGRWLADRGTALYFSADGKTVVAEGNTNETYDGSVRVYDVKTGTLRLEVQDAAFPTAINPDGSLLAATMSKTSGLLNYDDIVLWDIATGTLWRELGAEIQSQFPIAGRRGHYRVDSVVFSPDGSALLSSGPDAVRLWDTATGEHLRCYQTPAHTGVAAAYWSGAGATIVGTGTRLDEDASFDKEIYLWDPSVHWPAAVLPAGATAHGGPLSLMQDAGGTRLLAWWGFGSDDIEDRSAYLWDMPSRRLLAVLPTAGSVTAAALSPTGDRAVTVSTYAADSDSPDGLPQHETLLWDTQHAGVSLAASAQRSYWNALEASVDGKPLAAQQRLLRRARALSPALFGDIAQISEPSQEAYGRYLNTAAELVALEDGSPAAKAFTTDILDTNPKWLQWAPEQAAEQATEFIRHWDFDSREQLVAAYRRFATLAPTAAQAPAVTGALVRVLAPQALDMAQTGDVAGATAAIRAALVPYPGLEIQPEVEAQRMHEPESD